MSDFGIPIGLSSAPRCGQPDRDNESHLQANVRPLRVAQPDAVCEVGGSTPGLSYGDLGNLPGGGQTEKNVQHLRNDTLGTPLPISLKWLECSHREMWVLEVNLPLSKHRFCGCTPAEDGRLCTGSQSGRRKGHLWGVPDVAACSRGPCGLSMRLNLCLQLSIASMSSHPHPLVPCN